MSCNRENVVWPSADGTWNLGFFACYPTGDTSSPDYDYEWDVDYDHGSFEWVSTGHATREAALRSWDGANPGGCWSISDYATSKDECEAYDAMARQLVEARKSERNSPPPILW